MRIRLKNIGKIREADVEIKGVTVIAGENNTGKSTVGKALWSVFNGLVDFDENNTERKQDFVFDFLKKNALQEIEPGRVSRHKSTKILKNAANKIITRMRGKGIDGTGCMEIFKEILRCDQYTLDDSLPKSEFAYLEHVLTQNRDGDIGEFLGSVLEAEFNGDVLSSRINDGCGEINLVVKDNQVDLRITDDSVFCNAGIKDFYVSATYIDDPFAIDALNEDPYFGDVVLTHKHDVFVKLSSSKKKTYSVGNGYTKGKLRLVEGILNEVCEGDIIGSSTSGYTYELENGYQMDVRSLSTGLKSFAILKRFIKNETISFNGTIILDEPEVHLHPKWQLKFAEAIVLLQKEFDLHILVNTHSPYFLEAIEVYAAKHHIQDVCKYYLSTNDEDGQSIIEDVHENIDRIYRLLAEPFQTLETARYTHD